MRAVVLFCHPNDLERFARMFDQTKATLLRVSEAIVNTANAMTAALSDCRFELPLLRPVEERDVKPSTWRTDSRLRWCAREARVAEVPPDAKPKLDPFVKTRCMRTIRTGEREGRARLRRARRRLQESE